MYQLNHALNRSLHHSLPTQSLTHSHKLTHSTEYLSLIVILQYDLFLTHCRCRGLLLHLITQKQARAHTHANTHTHTRERTHTRTRAHTHAHARARTYTHTRARTYTHTRARAHTHTYTYSHTHTHIQSVGLPWTSDWPVAQTSTSQHTTLTTDRPLPQNTQHSQQTNFRAADGIRTRNPTKQTAADPRLRRHGHWNRRVLYTVMNIKLCYLKVINWHPFFPDQWRSVAKFTGVSYTQIKNLQSVYFIASSLLTNMTLKSLHLTRYITGPRTATFSCQYERPST